MGETILERLDRLHAKPSPFVGLPSAEEYGRMADWGATAWRYYPLLRAVVTAAGELAKWEYADAGYQAVEAIHDVEVAVAALTAEVSRG